MLFLVSVAFMQMRCCPLNNELSDDDDNELLEVGSWKVYCGSWKLEAILWNLEAMKEVQRREEHDV